MTIKALTLFPEVFGPYVHSSILGRALEKGLFAFEAVDIRAFTKDKHRRADDYPFGGGAGMVMTVQPIVDAVRHLEAEGFSGRRIYLSPRGRLLDQGLVRELAESDLMLLCGHYEGVDQRALDICGFEEISIGDYVLTGGELPALALIDAVARMVPGVLGSFASALDESHAGDLLEYDQYTRPREWEGHVVPEVLLNGNHRLIEEYQRRDALRVTKKNRPDLLDRAALSERDRKWLAEMGD